MSNSDEVHSCRDLCNMAIGRAKSKYDYVSLVTATKKNLME